MKYDFRLLVPYFGIQGPPIFLKMLGVLLDLAYSPTHGIVNNKI